MLGCHLELARHVVLAELTQEGLVGVGVREKVVEADAASHEDLLHARQRAKLAQELHVIAVVDLHAATHFGPEAALVHAGAARKLLGARRLAEVRRRAAHVVDVALEIRFLRDAPRLG